MIILRMLYTLRRDALFFDILQFRERERACCELCFCQPSVPWRVKVSDWGGIILGGGEDPFSSDTLAQESAYLECTWQSVPPQVDLSLRALLQAREGDPRARQGEHAPSRVPGSSAPRRRRPSRGQGHCARGDRLPVSPTRPATHDTGACEGRRERQCMGQHLVP